MQALGPACATCRQKCRRCDRGKPMCDRCISNGLECSGYPTIFKFYGASNTTKTRSRKTRLRKASQIEQTSPSPASEPGHTQLPADQFNCVGNHPNPGQRILTNELSRARTVAIIERVAKSAKPRFPEQPILKSVFDPPFEHKSPSTSIDTSHSSSPLSHNRDLSTLELESLLANERTQLLLNYYDNTLCPQLCVTNQLASSRNPFREFILPLAYEHAGLLHALLGLTSCHIQASPQRSSQFKTEAIEHRVEAIRLLSSTLSRQENSAGDISADVPLASILMLVLHDICDCGTSINGAHLSGSTMIVTRMLEKWRIVGQRRRTLFLLGVLSWLDLLRGFCGAEFLRFPPEIHILLTNHQNTDFESVVGCPRELFLIMSDAMSRAKEYKLGHIPYEPLARTLNDAERLLRSFDISRDIYPSGDPNWIHLAEAFRHACLLRVIRWHDTWASADDPKIQASVSAVLDACSQIHQNSPLLKRLLMPLFMAGADSLSLHQRHYVLLRIDEIRQQTSFRNPAAINLLDKVWSARSQQDADDMTNVPWMEFTCDGLLERQHDHLIF